MLGAIDLEAPGAALLAMDHLGTGRLRWIGMDIDAHPPLRRWLPAAGTPPCENAKTSAPLALWARSKLHRVSEIPKHVTACVSIVTEFPEDLYDANRGVPPPG